MGKKFVLLHGAWHGGWVWDGVIEELEKAGHSAEAPTMPGHRLEDDRIGVAFDHYADAVADVLAAQAEPVVLVGHSSAGFMMQAGAPRHPEKVERMIFHNAFILPHGMAQFDLVPPDVAKMMTVAAEASPDKCVPVDEIFVRGVLMDGESTDEQNALISRLVPQPLALFTTKINAEPFNAMTAPRTVLFCKDDASLPPGAYMQMAEGLGEYDLIEIDGGHETMFTRPKDIADALIRAVS